MKLWILLILLILEIWELSQIKKLNAQSLILLADVYIFLRHPNKIKFTMSCFLYQIEKGILKNVINEFSKVIIEEESCTIRISHDFFI